MDNRVFVHNRGRMESAPVGRVAAKYAAVILTVLGMLVTAVYGYGVLNQKVEQNSAGLRANWEADGKFREGVSDKLNSIVGIQGKISGELKQISATLKQR